VIIVRLGFADEVARTEMAYLQESQVHGFDIDFNLATHATGVCDNRGC
jgi:hypothetical protein